jgi:hypothetical protein
LGGRAANGGECKYFGNVPSGDDSSHDATGNLLLPDAYVKKLKSLGGLNRFKGGPVEDLSNWDLVSTDNNPHHLREFWIRNGGLKEDDQFAHESRHQFIAVGPSQKKLLTTLDQDLSDMKPSATSTRYLKLVKVGTNTEVVAVQTRTAPVRQALPVTKGKQPKTAVI